MDSVSSASRPILENWKQHAKLSPINIVDTGDMKLSFTKNLNLNYNSFIASV